MSISFRQPGLPGTPTAPGELTELSQAADEMRNRAQTAGGVSFAEWSDFTDVMRERLRHHGIVATADVASLPSLHQNDRCGSGEEKQDVHEL